jgi:hypothetical protein
MTDKLLIFLFLLIGVPFVINMIIPLKYSDEKGQDFRIKLTAVLLTLMVILIICAKLFHWIPDVPKEEWDPISLP